MIQNMLDRRELPNMRHLPILTEEKGRSSRSLVEITENRLNSQYMHHSSKIYEIIRKTSIHF